jgi:hypothetical protein
MKFIPPIIAMQYAALWLGIPKVEYNFVFNRVRQVPVTYCRLQ